MTNAEILQIAIKIISTKKTKEIRITLECDCEILLSPMVETDDGIWTKPCQEHDSFSS